MFKCQICKKQQPDGVGVTKVVTALRPKQYVNFAYKRRIVSNGWEIAEERDACRSCAAKHVNPPVPKPEPEAVLQVKL